MKLIWLLKEFLIYLLGEVSEKMFTHSHIILRKCPSKMPFKNEKMFFFSHRVQKYYALSRNFLRYMYFII